MVKTFHSPAFIQPEFLSFFFPFSLFSIYCSYKVYCARQHPIVPSGLSAIHLSSVIYARQHSLGISGKGIECKNCRGSRYKVRIFTLQLFLVKKLCRTQFEKASVKVLKPRRCFKRPVVDIETLLFAQMCKLSRKRFRAFVLKCNCTELQLQLPTATYFFY